jgi:hypothetical protein
LLNPTTASSFFDLQFAEESNTSLSERTMQVVILTVGAVWQGPYVCSSWPRGQRGWAGRRFGSDSLRAANQECRRTGPAHSGG